MPQEPQHSRIPEPTDADVDGVIAEAGGDMRAAIRMLLRDVMTLAMDADSNVSRGFVRGRVLRLAQR